MQADDTQVFFSSKPRVLHVAINIALAPVLLYLFGAWSWPPQLPHYIVFAITSLMALRYARLRWSMPRLVLDDKGLHCGSFYPAETIYKVTPGIRSVALTLVEDGKQEEKIVSLGWSSREDYRRIIALLSERFQRELPG